MSSPSLHTADFPCKCILSPHLEARPAPGNNNLVRSRMALCPQLSPCNMPYSLRVQASSIRARSSPGSIVPYLPRNCYPPHYADLHTRSLSQLRHSGSFGSACPDHSPACACFPAFFSAYSRHRPPLLVFASHALLAMRFYTPWPPYHAFYHSPLHHLTAFLSLNLLLCRLRSSCWYLLFSANI